ncbi:MAG: YlmC/YmxH family sporulation protein [Ruminiclostridium sp.]|nr:YlmC/YmxH family sporulation protein [Ruminiclostridium sp.]
MLCTFDDIRNKEIINIKSGRKIGYADDIEFDTCTAKICRLVIFGKAKLFGLLGREDDISICWSDIEIIGEDAILVTCDMPILTKKPGGLLKNLLK